MLEKREKILQLFIGAISVGQRVSKARRTSKSVNLFAIMSLLRLSGPWPTRRRTCGTWFWCQSFISICWHVCLWKLCVFTSVPPIGSRHHIQMPTSCSVVQGCLPRTVRCMDVSTCGQMWERLWGCAAARLNFAGNLTNWCAKSMTHLLCSSFRTWLWSNLASQLGKTQNQREEMCTKHVVSTVHIITIYHWTLAISNSWIFIKHIPF